MMIYYQTPIEMYTQLKTETKVYTLSIELFFFNELKINFSPY